MTGSGAREKTRLGRDQVLRAVSVTKQKNEKCSRSASCASRLRPSAPIGPATPVFDNFLNEARLVDVANFCFSQNWPGCIDAN
jgi:hypothetical protein